MARWITVWLSCISTLVAAQDTGIEFFEMRIRPLLVGECYQCHSKAEKIKGGLRLDWKGGWLAGGESGQAIYPGEPERSLLLKAIRHQSEDLQMPPKKRLSSEQIESVAHWIAMGAPDPRNQSELSTEQEQLDIRASREFWAFRPFTPPSRPSVSHADWPLKELDYFVLAAMESKGINPISDANDQTLLRRMHFDLNGLPPTIDEIQTFEANVQANRQRAIAKVSEDLLTRSDFGIQWGRHWLDVARFSESTGGGRTLLMNQAWRYRDYVIDAFNRNKPYDQFIREQIAGDLLPGGSLAERQERMIATAFLLLGPTNYELQDKIVLEMDIIDEQLDTMGKAFLGLTIGCARCHDHKFDPITTEDYYGMAGILKGTQSVIHSNVSTWNSRPLPMSASQEALVRVQSKEITALEQQIKEIKSQLGLASGELTPIKAEDLPGIVVDNSKAKLMGSWSSSTSVKNYINSEYLYAGPGVEEKRAVFPVNIPTAGRFEVRVSHTPNPNRSSQTLIKVRHADGEESHRINQKLRPALDGYFVSLGFYDLQQGSNDLVEISNLDADGVVIVDAIQIIAEGSSQPSQTVSVQESASTQDLDTVKDVLDQLVKQKDRLVKRAFKPTKVIAAAEAASSGDIPISIRGDANHLGKVTPRGFIQVLQSSESPVIEKTESGREQLAEWLGSESNPLSARVIVNRIWHHLFGRGIVSSVDNFGHMGRLPSNEPLLNHLAVRFVEQGWSIKTLIQEIMSSRTYQLDSSNNQNPEVSPDIENQLFGRQNRKRLSAESIRDAILAVSGQIDPRLGGNTIKPGTKIEYGYQFEGTRRSAYTPVFRNTPLEILSVFDFADPNIVVGQRSTSSVATQALYLMNSPFVREQSRHASKRLLSEDRTTDKARIESAYLRTIGRQPTEKEKQLILQFLKGRTDPEKAWAQVFHSLFASFEFRHLN